MMQILGVFAQFERETIVERTKVGMENKAHTGLWVGGPIPYGYRIDPEKKILVPSDEAFVVRMSSPPTPSGEGVRAPATSSPRRAPDAKRQAVGPAPCCTCYGTRSTSARSAGEPPSTTARTSRRPRGAVGPASAVLHDRADDPKGRQWNTDSERLRPGSSTARAASAAWSASARDGMGRRSPTTSA